MKITSIISIVLVIVGALVWLAVGIFGVNPITMLLGSGVVPRIIYVLVGLAGLWTIFFAIMYKPFRRIN
ncbi:MAG: DUF378 domain-containing protein [Clostridia bacterium]|nr:DUF378 domain-containing protein [Clostridia bacterium]